ncbi:MAG: 3-methyl-2-oxobutanoate hydroxymethyltransferase [Candidatus Goldbacteria bacterium]|nr:3-methyl-2-oxobutanoate hydroxymethyltransferase [Candidatus Goldiibacteriota bacterium]
MLTINEIKNLKNKRKIIALTAYDYLMAYYLEKAGVDIILVGDSLGMVFCGYKNTLPVTVDDMIYHIKAVERGAKNTFIVADMPFMSYQDSVLSAKRNAGKILKETTVKAVKLEGGIEIIPQIKALIDIGIPVMGHIGTQPQSVNKYGGYPIAGNTPEEIDKLMKSALELEKAGVFSIVLEKVKAKTAALITKSIKIPTIGIGSGPWCDGQILVTHDLLGAFPDFTPKFIKKYDNISSKIINTIKKFIKDVKNKKYPTKKYYF